MHDPTINPALLPPGVEPVKKPAQGGPAAPLKGPGFDEVLRQRVELYLTLVRGGPVTIKN